MVNFQVNQLHIGLFKVGTSFVLKPLYGRCSAIRTHDLTGMNRLLWPTKLYSDKNYYNIFSYVDIKMLKL